MPKVNTEKKTHRITPEIDSRLKELAVSLPPLYIWSKKPVQERGSKLSDGARKLFKKVEPHKMYKYLEPVKKPLNHLAQLRKSFMKGGIDDALFYCSEVRAEVNKIEKNQQKENQKTPLNLDTI